MRSKGEPVKGGGGITMFSTVHSHDSLCGVVPCEIIHTLCTIYAMCIHSVLQCYYVCLCVYLDSQSQKVIESRKPEDLSRKASTALEQSKKMQTANATNDQIGANLIRRPHF